MIADAFWDGREAERRFAVTAERLDGWGAEQWQARAVALARQIEYAEPVRVAKLYGRLSIVIDQIEENAS